MSLCAIAIGKSIGFTTNDPLRLLEDIQILRPHFLALVPRVLNRIYQAMAAAGDAPGIRGALFRAAVDAKVRNLRETGALTHPLWDRLVFKKVRALPHCNCVRLDADGVTRHRVVDQIVVNHGTVPLDELYFALKPLARNRGAVDYDDLIAGRPQRDGADATGSFQLFRIGDAVAARNTHAAIYDALRLVKDL